MADRNQESASDHTGAAPEREAAKVPGRGALIPQPHGGALLPGNRPGSNGGVHRGPDRYPRVTAAQFMRALIQPKKRRIKKPDGTTETVVVAMAMNEDVVTALQLIAEKAAKGRGVREFLKMLELEEKAFRNGNGHKNGHGPAAAAPTPPSFVRPTQPPESADEPGPKPDGGLTHGADQYA